MKHVRIATYEITEGTFQDVALAAEKGMLPTFRDKPGFIQYGLADVGDKRFVSISLWKTREDAQAAVPAAATWVRDNMSDQVQLRTDYVGDLAIFEGDLAKV
jgi:heme-degrading monooxygenase HmoA